MSATTVTFCITCRRDRSVEVAADATDGAKLAAQVKRHHEAHDMAGQVEIRTFRCLARCNNACNAVVQAPGKMGFVLSELEPGGDTAASVLEFAQAHARIENGVVPRSQRPQLVREKSIARVPDLAYRG